MERMPQDDTTGGREVWSTTGVTPDYINAAMMLGIVAISREEAPDPLELEMVDEGLKKPVEHYEEYLRRTRTGEEAERIIRESNSEKVAVINKLVDTFNADRERIVYERDYSVVASFFKELSLLVRGEKYRL